MTTTAAETQFDQLIDWVLFTQKLQPKEAAESSSACDFPLPICEAVGRVLAMTGNGTVTFAKMFNREFREGVSEAVREAVYQTVNQQAAA